MARHSKNTAVETPAEEAEVESFEEEFEDNTEVEDGDDTEPTTQADGEIEETPAEVSLDAFKEAVTKAVAERDESSGTLPEAQLETVNVEYRSLDGIKAKNQARTWIEEQMKGAIKDRDIQLARAFVDVKDNLSAAGGAGTPKAPADPTTAFVHRMAAHRLAARYLEDNVPEGVEGNWAERTDDLVTQLGDSFDEWVAYQNNDDEDAEAPDVSPVVRSAFKLANGKASGGGSPRVSNGGPRRDIAKHIEQVFEDVEEDSFLTVNDIAKRRSEEYGSDQPSPGAISARLFPKGRDPLVLEVEGAVIQAEAPDNGPRGARKVAA